MQDVPQTSFEIFADPSKENDDPPPIPPITQSPSPSDTLIFLPDGSIIISN